MLNRNRVLHVVESLDRGGLERVVCDLVLEQHRRGWSVEVFCLFSQGAFAKELFDAGIRVSCGGKRKGLDFAVLSKLRDVARSGGYRLIHTHNPVANYYTCMTALFAWRRFIVVNTRHNMGAQNAADRREKLFRISLLRTAVVVMVSDQVRIRFVGDNIVPDRKAAVIMNGIPVGRYQAQGPLTKQMARSRLGLRDEWFVVGAVGRLAVVKNHALLMQAVAPLCREYPGFRLILVGDGELRQHLQEKAAALGISHQVVFTGERNDIPEILAAFDVFAMPSLSEGHSIALLEAAAVGLPIVATAVGGNPEIVQDGVTGLLVPSNDHSALRIAISGLTSDQDRRQALGHNARAWAINCVSVSSMTDNYLNLYESLLPRSASRV